MILNNAQRYSFPDKSLTDICHNIEILYDLGESCPNLDSSILNL